MMVFILEPTLLLVTCLPFMMRTEATSTTTNHSFRDFCALNNSTHIKQEHISFKA